MARAAGTTTEEILSVDGVILNTFAKNIESLTGRLRTPAKRTSNVVVPGRHGTVRTKGKKFDQNFLILPMWVVGCDDDGRIPSGGSARKEFFKNVDALTQLFQGGDEELDIRHTLPDGSIRQCFADVQEMVDFTVTGVNPIGKFSVNLSVHDAFWQDLTDRTESKDAGLDQASFTILRDATAVMEDLTATITGPWTNPKITFADGSWLQYNAAIPAGQGLVINSGTWSLSGVGGLVPDLSKLVYSGTSSHFIAVPSGKPGDAILVDFAGSARVSGQTEFTLTGRRKFLVG